MIRRYSVVIQKPSNFLDAHGIDVHVEFVEATSSREAARYAQMNAVTKFDMKSGSPENYHVLFVASGFIDIRAFGSELKGY